MTIIEIIAIFVIHWFADFVMQDEKWALGKSKNWKDLLSHTVTYSMIWFYIGIFYIAYKSNLFVNMEWYNNWSLTLFAIITFICHTITDYFTSRIVSEKFANKEYGSSIPNFEAFTIIGFDQVLHYLQLFLTYYWLVKI